MRKFPRAYLPLSGAARPRVWRVPPRAPRAVAAFPADDTSTVARPPLEPGAAAPTRNLRRRCCHSLEMLELNGNNNGDKATIRTKITDATSTNADKQQVPGISVNCHKKSFL